MTRQTNTGKSVKGLRQSVLPLSFNLDGMPAQTLLALYLDPFSATSGVILLFPSVLSIKVPTGWLSSGRLGTAPHAGTIRASYVRNTKYLYPQLCQIITITLGSSIMTGLAASLFGTIPLGIAVKDCLATPACIITTLSLTLAPISPMTVVVSMVLANPVK